MFHFGLRCDENLPIVKSTTTWKAYLIVCLPFAILVVVPTRGMGSYVGLKAAERTLFERRNQLGKLSRKEVLPQHKTR